MSDPDFWLGALALGVAVVALVYEIRTHRIAKALQKWNEEHGRKA